MLKEYKTVIGTACCEIEEKKSKFIASVKPVSTEEEALEFINGLKSKYWDATHNVYAYYIVGETVIQRFSDDGEPSGTAGMPVLEMIKRMEVQNLVVVVTRYFGGTLLGAAGLIRTYAKSAQAGIQAAGIVKKILCREIAITTEYTLFGKIQNFLGSRKFNIKDIIYKEDVQILVYVPVDMTDNFAGEIIQLTNAKAVVEPGEKLYITVDEEGKVLS